MCVCVCGRDRKSNNCRTFVLHTQSKAKGPFSVDRGIYERRKNNGNAFFFSWSWQKCVVHTHTMLSTPWLARTLATRFWSNRLRGGGGRGAKKSGRNSLIVVVVVSSSTIHRLMRWRYRQGLSLSPLSFLDVSYGRASNHCRCSCVYDSVPKTDDDDDAP